MSTKDSMSLPDAVKAFKSLLNSLNEANKQSFIEVAFEELVTSENKVDIIDVNKLLKKDPDATDDSIAEEYLDDPVAKLNTIANYLKTKIPLNAVLPSENIMSLGVEENTAKFTVHIDEFLYEEDEVEELIDEDKLKRHYCKDCGSTNIEPQIFISHSLQRDALYYIFSVRLPVLENKTVLDIGSRLGAVLYGAYVFTDAKRIIGVEMNEDFCKLQNETIKKYNMDDRIEVYQNRIENTESLVESADVIVINNAFKFHNTTEKQVEIWEFLKSKIRKGTILVIRPQLDVTFKDIKTDIVIDDWVKPYGSPEDPDTSGETALDPYYLDHCDIAFYQVL